VHACQTLMRVDGVHNLTPHGGATRAVAAATVFTWGVGSTDSRGEERCVSRQARRLNSAVSWLWAQWWLATLGWHLCSLFCIYTLSKSTERTKLTTYANLLVGFPVVAPFVLSCDECQRLTAHIKPVLLIALCAGLEKNLTNSSLTSIGAGLKTALHSLNVIFTFFIAIALGVDEVSAQCVRRCRCRGNFCLIVALMLVTAGGLVTGLCVELLYENAVGIVLQLSSGVMYGIRLSVTKMLLSHDGRRHGFLIQPPSKSQVAFVSIPIIGLVSFAFRPVFELFEEKLPSADVRAILLLGLAIPLMVVCQLRLMELTSPLTVAVLSVMRDVEVVLFFAVTQGEIFTTAQKAGFSVSVVGALVYAGSTNSRAKPGELTREAEFGMPTADVEQESWPSDDEGWRHPRPVRLYSGPGMREGANAAASSLMISLGSSKIPAARGREGGASPTAGRSL